MFDRSFYIAIMQCFVSIYCISPPIILLTFILKNVEQRHVIEGVGK